MILKEVILQDELKQVKEFLLGFDLHLDEVDTTIYLEEDGNIIGTVSSFNYIIKCLAVNPNYQGDDLAGKLITEIISKLNQKGITSYQVFTKTMYKKIFLSFGFKLLVETSKVAMLESGAELISDAIKKIKTKVEMTFAPLDENVDIASVVINANPVTLGHVHLVEEASKNHNLVIVFVVEEDKSKFDFQTRFSLCYLAFKRLSNVCVVPSSKYMVSSLTFPSYFLKNDEEVKQEQYLIDALLFREYFMKQLFIKKRYVGSESNNKMVSYNNTLKEVLGDNLTIIERLKDENGNDVSARKVRTLLENKQINEAISYIPNECKMVFLMMVQKIYG